MLKGYSFFQESSLCHMVFEFEYHKEGITNHIIQIKIILFFQTEDSFVYLLFHALKLFPDLFCAQEQL